MAPELNPDLGPLTILVVEDDVLIRLMLGEALREVGLRVVEAADAGEAWSYVLSGAALDLVVSDVQMPGGLDGQGLAQRIRTAIPGLPIILTSGAAKRLTDCDMFWPKPYELGAAVAAVLEILAMKKGIPKNE